jgi:hypothetical protein
MDRTTSKWEHYPAAKLDALDTSGRRKPRKYVGRTTGMGVEQYQDYTLYINDDRDGLVGRHLIDDQLRRLAARVSRGRTLHAIPCGGRQARFCQR